VRPPSLSCCFEAAISNPVTPEPKRQFQTVGLNVQAREGYFLTAFWFLGIITGS